MTYHRLLSTTQTTDLAQRQQQSGEVWGEAPWGSNIPKVKAYVGELPPGRAGIEFTTDTPPDPNCPPGHAYWSGPRGGVEVVGGSAKIRVTVTKTVQV